MMVGFNHGKRGTRSQPVHLYFWILAVEKDRCAYQRKMAVIVRAIP